MTNFDEVVASQVCDCGRWAPAIAVWASWPRCCEVVYDSRWTEEQRWSLWQALMRHTGERAPERAVGQRDVAGRGKPPGVEIVGRSFKHRPQPAHKTVDHHSDINQAFTYVVLQYDSHKQVHGQDAGEREATDRMHRGTRRVYKERKGSTKPARPSARRPRCSLLWRRLAGSSAAAAAWLTRAGARRYRCRSHRW